ncbi:hypothetical protein B0E41_03850 [Hydrogenophaga sp. A37]|nr:hypothetical protein B0E41_03850 [Hydrogenophaga sp. A37]
MITLIGALEAMSAAIFCLFIFSRDAVLALGNLISSERHKLSKAISGRYDGFRDAPLTCLKTTELQWEGLASTIPQCFGAIISALLRWFAVVTSDTSGKARS